MSQPTPYDRQNSFTLLASENPDAPYTGADLDAEFNALKITLDELLARVALVQRDDGELANESVGPDQLAASLSLGFNPPTAWAADTAYSRFDAVFNTSRFFTATEAHTSSSDFEADLAAGKWTLVATFDEVAIGDGSITTDKLADLAVTSGKIAAEAVATAKIQNLAVTSAKIASGAVVADKIGSNAVTSDKIQDEAVTNAKIPDAGIGYAKLANAALSSVGALTPATDKFAYYTSSTVAALATVTTFARSVLDDADAATARATLGLGTAAVLDVGTTASKVVQLTAAAKLPAVDGSLLTGVVSSSTDYQAFTANGTWTKPANVVATSRVLVEMWGGGGGGSTASDGGGGGGGGYISRWFLASDLTSTVAVTRGAGGAANGAGANSTFGAYLTAYGGGLSSGGTSGGGGGGGQTSAGSANASGVGGAGGGPQLAAGGSGAVGTFGVSGGGGGAYNKAGGASFFGGGGGAGGDSGNGGASVYGGGGGAGSGAGAGGTSVYGGAGGASGVAGSAPGGGGGRNAAGGRGEIRVTTFI